MTQDLVVEEASEGAGPHMGRRVAVNSLWLIGQPLLLNALSILSTAYIARKLGATDFGTFNLGFAQVALFTPLCNLGLRAVAVRAIAEDRENAQETVRAVFALRVLFTIAAVLLTIGWLALPIYSDTTRIIGAAAVITLICTSCGNIAVDLFMGFERSRLAAQPQMVGGVVLTLLSVAALLAGLGLPGFVAAYVFGSAVQLGLLLWTARRHFFALAPAWDWPRMKEYLLQTRPFALMNVVSSVADGPVLALMILGAMFGAAAVGPYSQAVGLIARLTIIPYGLGDAMYPAVAGCYRKNKAEVEETVRRAVLNVLLLTVPIALCLSFTAPTVLWILFGQEYVSAAPALRVVAWLLPLSGLSYLIRECLSGIRQQDVVARLTLVDGGLLILFYGTMIPLWGPFGAAVAAVAREVVMLVIWLRALSAHFGRPVHRPDFVRAGLAVAAMSVPLLWLVLSYTHTHAVLASAGAMTCFAGSALWLGIVSTDRLPFLRRR